MGASDKRRDERLSAESDMLGRELGRARRSSGILRSVCVNEAALVV
jgi:hypothetical protein